MSRSFTPRQRYRILVAHAAQVIVDGDLVHVARYVYGVQSETRRYAMLRKLNCVVRCACGCDVWAALRDIQFDHETPHAAGGLTVIKNGRPIRTRPCHVAKSGGEQVTTGWCTRVRRKLRTQATQGAGCNHLQDSQVRSPSLSVTAGSTSEDDSRRRARPSRRLWPTRPMSHPLFKRRFSGEIVRRAP